MKQAILFLGILTAVFFTTGNLAHTNVAGAPAGRTGSPGDEGNSCNNAYCHGYSSQNSGEYIDIFVDFPLSSTDAYRITVEAANTGSFQYEKVGFQACVEDAEGNKIGQITIVDPTLTQIVEQHYITHTELGTAPSSQSVNLNHMWEFDWTPPADFLGQGAIIYAASMLTNNNGENNGDVFVSNSHTFMVGVGLEELNDFEFTAFPNPTAEQITLDWKENPGENTNVYLCDAKGAITTLVNGDLNQTNYTFSIPSHLARGIYTLNVSSKKGQSSKRIVLQ